jgi:hypothetical protein
VKVDDWADSRYGGYVISFLFCSSLLALRILRLSLAVVRGESSTVVCVVPAALAFVFLCDAALRADKRFFACASTFPYLESLLIVFFAVYVYRLTLEYARP